MAVRVRALGRKDVRNSCKRIAATLAREGIPISFRTVWKILKAAGLATAKDRQRAIESKAR
ncbi:hypothetical protein KEU06_20720 [Pseudaminobacter sp. 19-2017]|uniref:Uncharacterized protein n=1 Tax=Pseudaminobacter soli (ex Zhang et al. 2022) TaxID=2831468 RepID=A0A942E4J8_9HYPH|nr:hypothetical protein [Pseudaminobacter soli]